MTENSRCFMCSRQTAIGEPAKDDAWDLGSLKMILAQFKLCPKHVTYCEARIPELEKKVVILKTGDAVTKYQPKVNLPPVVEAPRSFYEREPGEDG